MASIVVDRVIIRRAGLLKRKWRARSYGANNEQIALTQMYGRITDAEAAAKTIADGAPITIED